jgi:hypothetical protein
VICTLIILGHIFTFKHLCLHSITKILRNGPKAHFPFRVGEGATFDPTRDMFPHLRVARPPAEGRGRNQLLPRYWPRITDQELQQISGEYP